MMLFLSRNTCLPAYSIYMSAVAAAAVVMDDISCVALHTVYSVSMQGLRVCDSEKFV
jgi:hypothetical protein